MKKLMTFIVWLLLSYSALGLVNVNELSSYENVFVTRVTLSEQPEELHRNEHWIVTAYNTTFELDLSRNKVVLPNYKRFEIDENGVPVRRPDRASKESCHYDGIVKGVPSSHAVISLCSGTLHGEITTPLHRFFIEPHHAHFESDKTETLRTLCIERPFASGRHCREHHAALNHHKSLLASPLWLKRVIPHISYKQSDLTGPAIPGTCGVQTERNQTMSPTEEEHWMLSDVFGAENVAHRRMNTMFLPTIKYVEIIVFNDFERYSALGSNINNVELNTEMLINIVNSRYLRASFSPEIRVVLVAQFTTTSSGSDPWGDPGVCSPGSSERDHTTLLSTFLSYSWGSTIKTAMGDQSYDNTHLLTSYNLCSSVVGFAPVGSICNEGTSGGITQATFANQQSANVVAHELGHNFNMLHDGTSNSCPISGNVMAASGCLSCSDFVTDFSSCSQGYMDTLMTYRPTTTECLDNVPEARFDGYTNCGDGILDDDEECDCGSSDCSSIDPCCDGSQCRLVAGAECSSANSCCDSCSITPASANKVCRAAFDTECDVPEVCDGASSKCPANLYKEPGLDCTDDIEGIAGKCYNGGCVSHGMQCKGMFATTSGPCSSIVCNSGIRCLYNGQCSSFTPRPGTGTPCGTDSQCRDGSCISSAAFHFTWQTQCTANCTGGGIEREVLCRKYDGTFVSDSECSDAGPKPTEPDECTGFAPVTCDLEAVTSTGSTVGPGDSVNITWNAIGAVDSTAILAFTENETWPAYITIGLTEQTSYLYTIPNQIVPGLKQLLLVSSVSSLEDTTSANFTVDDPCLSISCNDGTCFEGLCTCDAGFAGTFCNQTLCEAQETPCLNGGTCSTTEASCTCTPSFKGSQCQIPNSCTLECGANAEADAACVFCSCFDGFESTNGDCKCARECRSGAPDASCSSCICPFSVGGDECQFTTVNVTFPLTSSIASNLTTARQTSQFSELFLQDIAFVLAISTDRLTPIEVSFSSTGDNTPTIKFELLGSSLNVQDMGALVDTLVEYFDTASSLLRRGFATSTLNFEAQLLVEGNLPQDNKPGLLGQIVDWIKGNLAIVIPVGVFVGLLAIYKIRSDRDESDQRHLAGADERTKAHHMRKYAEMKKQRMASKNRQQAAHGAENAPLLANERAVPRKSYMEKPRASIRPSKPQADKVQPHDALIRARLKKMERHEEEYKERDRARSRLLEDFGAMMRNGYDERMPLFALSDDPLGAGLPPNWTVQYFADGTLFFFNSVTDDISLERPSH